MVLALRHHRELTRVTSDIPLGLEIVSQAMNCPLESSCTLVL